MFKRWCLFPLCVLVLLAGCVPAEAAEPTTIVVPPTATPTPPSPTSTLISTSQQPAEKVSGQIAYSSDQDGDFEIWLMNVNGSDQLNLTDNDAMDISPAWSPDGSQIAFVSNRDGSDDIYVMNADGSDVRRLTQTDDASESFPAWSPDGTKISFDSDRGGNWDIYVMASDGSDVRQLTDHSSDDWISSWSPDGSQIVFESRRDGNYEIYVMDADGGDQQRLTDNSVHDGFPSWSPDGTQIAYMSRRDGNYEIYVMDVDGSNLQRITDHRAGDTDPDWSPDGEWLSFVSQRDSKEEIYIIKIESGDVYQVTDNRSQNWSPSWYPLIATSSQSSTWVKTFEDYGNSAFFDTILNDDGDILVVGATDYTHVPPFTGDALFMKLTLQGVVLWESTWGGDGYDHAWAVAPAEDGGYYVFGETDSHGAGDRDFFLLKITDDGTEDWFRTYGRERKEWPYGMLQLSNGDLLLYGYTISLAGNARYQYALRVRPDGEVIWEYIGEDSEIEKLTDAVEIPGGELVFAAVSEENAKLVKLDANGDFLWSKRYELLDWQFVSQVIQTDSGGFLLAGSRGTGQGADTWLAYSSSTGELEWEKTIGDLTAHDFGQSLIRLNDGTYLIGGRGNGLLLSRIDEDGDLLWQRSMLGRRVYGASALIELEEGGYIVAGFIEHINGVSCDAIILRTDSEGWVEE